MQQPSDEPILASPISEPPLARVAIVIVLTLLPWPAVWFGMYQMHSIAWSFFLYHGMCLLPAILWRWPLWKDGVKVPSAKEWFLLASAALVTSLIAWVTYSYSGALIIDRTDVVHVLTEHGYLATWLLPLAAYFIVINASTEELLGAASS
jgi:hypothetical protein